MKRIPITLAILTIAFGCARMDRVSEPGENAPLLLAAIARGQNNIELIWKSPETFGEIKSYRIYLKAGDSAPQPVGSFAPAEAPGIVHSGKVFLEEPTGVFLVSAIDEYDSESGLSNALPVGAGDDKSEILLIMDGSRSPDCSFEAARKYANALEQLDKTFNACLSDALFIESDTAISLEKYEYVLWNCGGEKQMTLSPMERDALGAFLDQEGRAFICGSDVASDLSETEQGTDFLNGYLKAFHDPTDKPLDADTLIGSQQDRFFAEIEELTLDGDETVQACIDSSPELIEGYGGSQPVLFYDGIDGVGAVAYVGNYGTPNKFARMVYAGFAFESLATDADRVVFLDATLQYLENAGPLRYVALVQGSVKDEETGEPLAAEIELLGGSNYLGTPVKGRARENGTYNFIALEGVYHLRFAMDDYVPKVYRGIWIQKGDPLTVDVELEPKE